MKRLLWASILGMGLLCVGCPSHARAAATNLLTNGSFDDPVNPLSGWMTDYAWTDNKFYRDNRLSVSVVPRFGPREKVLRLHGTRLILWGTGQGTKVDSKPIPYVQGATYRLSLLACKEGDKGAEAPDGPNARVFLEGYHWRPGVKPHPDPDLTELRKVYKQGSGSLLYFSGTSGPFSNPQKSWKQGTCTFPPKTLSAEGRAHLKLVQFLSVHIVAIDGWDGSLYVDDVKVERID